MHPVILLILLVVGLALISWYKRAPSAQKKQARKKALIIAGITVVVIGLATGRLNPMFAAIMALIPAAMRVLTLVQTAQAFKGGLGGFGLGSGDAGPSAGQRSQVRTSFLEVTLDHDSGAMSGQVVAGPYAGRSLDDMELEELMRLLDLCRREDAQSASVLEAYLDRAHGATWRDADGGRRGQGAGAVAGMSLDEAREVLGVAVGASREEIVEAHRRLMQRMHPDRGGSTYLAAKINQAKDLLLGA